MKKHEERAVGPHMNEGAYDLYRRYTSTGRLIGEDFDGAMRKYRRYFSVNFARYLPSIKNVPILEIGCGYGKNLLALKSLGYRNLRGMDISQEQIAYARGVLGLEEAEEADLFEWLRNTKEKFHCIVLIDVLEHLELASLIELGKLLKQHLHEDGMLIIQVPNDMALLNPIRAGDLTHVRAFTPQSMAQFLRNSGLSAVSMNEALPSSVLRRFLWRWLIHPVLFALFTAIHGRYAYASVFSANMVVVARQAP